jgi:hypothetical protein
MILFLNRRCCYVKYYYCHWNSIRSNAPAMNLAIYISVFSADWSYCFHFAFITSPPGPGLEYHYRWLKIVNSTLR